MTNNVNSSSEALNKFLNDDILNIEMLNSINDFKEKSSIYKRLLENDNLGNIDKDFESFMKIDTDIIRKYLTDEKMAFGYVLTNLVGFLRARYKKFSIK